MMKKEEKKGKGKGRIERWRNMERGKGRTGERRREWWWNKKSVKRNKIKNREERKDDGKRRDKKETR